MHNSVLIQHKMERTFPVSIIVTAFYVVGDAATQICKPRYAIDNTQLLGALIPAFVGTVGPFKDLVLACSILFWVTFLS